MQVTVFGASGKVGQLVTTELLRQGYTVVAFVHRHAPFQTQPRLSVVQGDIHDAAAVARALAGSEVVISTLGSWGTSSKDIVSTATKHIITATQPGKALRFISVTGAEAEVADEHSGLLHAVSHFALRLIAPQVLQDAEVQLALLQASELDWTVIRSPIMTSHQSRKHRLTTKRPGPWATISRRAVAAALVAQITDSTWQRQAPYIRRQT
jgi:putative NADH-flavin reductase